MIRRFIRQIKYYMMARQLRRPSGRMGNKVGRMMNRANGYLYDRTLSVMKPAEGDTILEIGFGNGQFFDKVFSASPRLQIKGIDYSPTMVREASGHNRAAVAAGKLEIVGGNSKSMPFGPGSFDKVFCINVVYFWDDPRSHLREINRVLKPGGKFYVTIRTRESMEKMPFTKFGFIKYDTESWASQVSAAGLRLENEVVIPEPAAELEGKAYHIISVCLVAVKAPA